MKIKDIIKIEIASHEDLKRLIKWLEKNSKWIK